MPISRPFRHAWRTLPLLLALLAASLLTCASAFAATTGEQKTAVILVNFQDDASQPITRTEAHALVFGQVSDLYWEASYQKTFLSGDTYGWYTIPVTRNVCDTALFAREADKLAVASGVDLSKYQRLIYLLPQNSCTNAGSNSGSELPSRTWLSSNSFDAQLIAHELGHNFGLLHAQALECGAASYGSGCGVKSYGDTADTMGSGTATHFNAILKEQLGWLGGSGQPAITTVTASGTYAIAPLETAGTVAKALKIARGVDPITGEMNYYYVEYRQPTGFDTVLGNIGNLTKGVLVRTGGHAQESMMLDMTPDSVPSSTFTDMNDAALTVGRSYADGAAGVTITLKSADANGAVVQVDLKGSTPPATCTRTAPLVSLGGPGTAVAAGASLNYSVSLTNRDSSGCGATSFNLARSVPSGWTGTLAATSLSVSPGAIATTTLTVTSSASAAAGNYGIGVAASGAGSVHTANASGTYSVAVPSGALSETVATDKTGYLRGETVYMSARVLGGGNPVSGANVRFIVTLPSGGSTVLNATSGGDGFARATYKVAKAKSAIGAYQVRADATSGSSSASASTGFSVR